MTRLRYERKTRRLSQIGLGKAVRINQPDLSQIERGILVPTEAQLARLAAHFNVPAHELLKEVVLITPVVN